MRLRVKKEVECNNEVKTNERNLRNDVLYKENEGKMRKLCEHSVMGYCVLITWLL